MHEPRHIVRIRISVRRVEKAKVFPPFFSFHRQYSSLHPFQTYDAFGRRVRKVASGLTTIYDYDVAGNLISESEADGTPLRDIVYLNGERVAMRLYGSQAGWYYFVNDHLGTPQKIVDSSGVVVWQAAYLPFGKAQILSGSVITNNFRFPGQYYDAETELHYNWHRYYMPGKGRYLTGDPIGFAGGDTNLYGYCLNDPVNLVDPEGLIIVHENGVTVEHYGTGDHGPPHAHVKGGGLRKR